MLSQTVKYALRILGHLGNHPGEWLQGDQIARATGIPSNYLSKILSQLRKRGLVHSQKGWGGGFVLDARASRIPIAEVVELFDGKREQSSCLFGLSACDPDNPCPLHSHWDRISKSFDRMLASTTIGDLKTGPASRRN
ncbi:MAG: Rrf2 family transcriptional regulator [Deltaproteobacteria bacterium]|nr:Rrf2 family transcriptional regulator [Deltaproteobacteria bacterium]